MNLENPIKEINDWYIQNIIDNNNTIFRAFANVFYWINNQSSDKNIRNLGFYSTMQTTLANIYKSQVVKWLSEADDSIQKDAILKQILPYVKYGKISEFVTRLSMDVSTLTNCVVELFVLSRLYDTLIYIYNEDYDIIYGIHPATGIFYDRSKNKQPIDLNKYKTYPQIVYLQFNYFSGNIHPDRIAVMYPRNQ